MRYNALAGRKFLARYAKRSLESLSSVFLGGLPARVILVQAQFLSLAPGAVVLVMTAPTRRTFGTRLLERAIAHDLSGFTRLEYAPSGVCWDATAPIGR